MLLSFTVSKQFDSGLFCQEGNVKRAFTYCSPPPFVLHKNIQVLERAVELFVWSDMKPLRLYCKALSPPPPSECSHRSAASLQNQQASSRWGLSPLFFQAVSALSSEVSKC